MGVAGHIRIFSVTNEESGCQPQVSLMHALMTEAPPKETVSTSAQRAFTCLAALPDCMRNANVDKWLFGDTSSE